MIRSLDRRLLLLLRCSGRAPSSSFRLWPVRYSFRRTIISRGLPFVAIPSPPWPICIFTEWTVMTNVSRALKLAFDWATFSNTDQITSPVIWSLLLKLIPMAMSFTSTSLLIVIPTISLSSRSRNAYSNNSVTLSRKWEMGFGSSSSPSGGGKRRTVSCVPWAFKRLTVWSVPRSWISKEGEEEEE